MKMYGLKARITSILLLAGSLLAIAPAHARVPAPGLYENSTSIPLIALLDSARKMIDIEIYSMNDPIVQKAILNAQADRVKVRIIQEPAPVATSCRIFQPVQPTDDAACLQMKSFREKVIANGGVYVPFNKALCGPLTANCVQHGKMVIVDSKIALLSTGNFDSSSMCNKLAKPDNCNRDYSYVIRYLPAVQTLGQVFEHDLAGIPYDLPKLLARPGARDLTVSPHSMAPLVSFINSAKSSIVIQEQYLKDPMMNAAIMEALKAGLVVKIMVASACFYGRPSPNDAVKWTATYGALEAAGAQIRVFTRKMRVGGLDGYLHAKAILVDGKTAWVGSVNGSTQALVANREFGVFFDAPRDIKTLLGFMQGDFNHPQSESWQESLKCVKD